MLAFTRTDLERLFPSTTWQRAESLREQSAVVEINVERDGRSITGRVRGERRTPYLTRVNIVNGRGGRIRLSSTCTCLVYTECEHAAATLLAAAGTDVATIGRILGHRPGSVVTLRYLHTDDERLRQAAEAVAHALRSA